MVPTNHYYRTKLRQLDARVRQIELQMEVSGSPAALPLLEELRIEREVFNLVLLNRKVESARAVVDLRRWREANGAAALVSPPETDRRSAAIAS
jgi:hypothetical protein